MATMPAVAYADQSLTGKDFLSWPEANRSSYARIAGSMAGMIAVENGRTEQRDCINDWYFSDESQSNAYVADVMKDYPSAHPLAILFAILEQKCGSFDYRGK